MVRSHWKKNQRRQGRTWEHRSDPTDRAYKMGTNFLAGPVAIGQEVVVLN